MKLISLLLYLLLLPTVALAEGETSEGSSYKLLFILAPVLAPIIANYIIKSFESRNFTNRITRELEINQKRMEFVKNYYAIQKEFLTDEKVTSLRAEVTEQLSTIKKETDDVLTDSYWLANVAKLSKSQRLFLAFTPVSFMGWVWRIVYYLLFGFLLLSLLGYAIDESGEYSWDALLVNLQDSDLNIGMFFFVCLLVISQQLALWTYEEKMKKQATTSV